MRMLSLVLTSAIFLPQEVLAQLADPCITSAIPCAGDGAQGVNDFLAAQPRLILQEGFKALLGLAFAYYAFRLIVNNGENSVIDETKSAYTNAVAGAVIVGSTFAITAAFSGTPDAAPLEDILGQIEFFIRAMVATAATVLITVQGFRLVSSLGDQSQFDLQKKRFANGLGGVIIVQTASAIVDSLRDGTPTTVSFELLGLINFTLTIFASLCVLAFIVAGALLVISIDEGLRDQAKKSALTAAVCFAVVAVSWSLVNYFLFL